MQHAARSSLLGTALTMLLLAAPAQATFPGANGKLALTSNKNLAGTRVETVNPDGTGRVALTTEIAGNGNAAWSPDGTRLAFSSYDYRTGISAVEVMDAGGGNRRIVASGIALGNPAWSPDGSKLVFVHGDGLSVVDANGGTPTQIPLSLDAPHYINSPDWSPDGTQIAFDAYFEYEYCDPYDPPECYQQYTPSAIYVVAPDGSGLAALTSYEYNDGSSPSWSPDGSEIAFQGTYEIQVMDADGSNQRNLGVRGYAPVWSPDGERIAFATRVDFTPDHGGDIYTMASDGTNPVKIVEGSGGIDDPSFATSSWQAILNHPPDCSGVAATPRLLWPANKKLRLVALDGATDPDGDAVTLAITGVTQDEPVRGARDAQHSVGDDAVRLRTDRDSRGDGRVYTIAFEATDGEGGSCEGVATVSVPRHRRVAAVDSAPPSYDSFGH
jgi:dipeptidyl aminopeptidase/acylaminoacyl peptidase